MKRFLRILMGIALCVTMLALLGGCVPLIILTNADSGYKYVTVGNAVYWLDLQNKTAVLSEFVSDGSEPQKFTVPATVEYRKKKFTVDALGEGNSISSKVKINQLVLSENVQYINCDLAAIDALTSISVAENNKAFRSHDGVLYRIAENGDCTLYVYPAAKKDVTVELCADYLYTDDIALWANPYLQGVTIEENDRYQAVDGVLYTKDGKEMVLYPLNRPNQTFVAPSNLRSFAIDCHIWDNQNIKQAESLSDSLVAADGMLLGSNGKELMFCVRKSKTLRVPDGVTIVGYRVLDGVQYVYLPASVAVLLDSFATDGVVFGQALEIFCEANVLPALLDDGDFNAEIHLGCTAQEFEALEKLVG